MKSNATIRRSMLATLLVFATAALGLQPLVFSSNSGCECKATETGDVHFSVAESSCCASPAPKQVDSCCSSNPTASTQQMTTKGCCCNPEANVCKCVNCKCSLKDKDSSITSSPAIPMNETTEIVSPVPICPAPFVACPHETGKQRFGFPRFAVDFAALSSKQTCVLLSRFTC